MLQNIIQKLFNSPIPASPFQWKHLPEALFYWVFSWKTSLLSHGFVCLPALSRPRVLQELGWMTPSLLREEENLSMCIMPAALEIENRFCPAY